MADDDTKTIDSRPGDEPDPHASAAQAPTPPETRPPLGAGQSFGPYTLLERLGEGGFGDVYLAEQTEPVRRRVALKLLKPGMDSRSVIGRFEAERQTLAMMDHPGIATVLDAGRTPDGRPYFAMEYVRGQPITVYANAAQLSVRERIALLRTVCRAVQHAHQKGVIHRDLKPSNVLVAEQDGQALPKVIDFGIAKALSGPTHDSGVYTRAHQMLGTPAYMSPEQAGGAAHAVDTRSDVYSLGALCYELLAGSTPLDAQTLGKLDFKALHEAVANEPSPTLVAKLESASDPAALAAERGTDLPKLRASLAGELDWIVRRCLEKDAARRYPTVAALDEDLRRYLEHEPVTAGRPSRLYLFKKFVRRRRVEVLAGALLLLVLTAGLLGSSLGWARAEQESARTRDTLEFFRQTLAGAAAESSAIGVWSDDPSLTLGDALTPAVGLIDETFAGDADLEATIRQLVGLAQLRSGRFPDAIRQLGRALEAREADLGPNDARTLALLLPIAEARSKSGDVDGALAAAGQAYERHAQALGAADEVTRTVALWIARWHSSGFRFREADRYFGRAQLTVAGTPDTSDAVTLAALIEGAWTAANEGELARAERTLRAAEPEVQRLPESEDVVRKLFTRQLGYVLVLRGKSAEAIELLSAGDDGAAYANDRVRERLLAWAESAAGETDAARARFTRLLVEEAAQPGTVFRAIFLRLYFADAMLFAGDASEAAAQASAAIERYDAESLQNDPDRLWGRAVEGIALVDLFLAGDEGALDGARRAIEDASALEARFPEHRLHVPIVRHAMSRLAHATGDAAAAAAHARVAFETATEVFGPDHARTRVFRAWRDSL